MHTTKLKEIHGVGWTYVLVGTDIDNTDAIFVSISNSEVAFKIQSGKLRQETVANVNCRRIGSQMIVSGLRIFKEPLRWSCKGVAIVPKGLPGRKAYYAVPSINAETIDYHVMIAFKIHQAWIGYQNTASPQIIAVKDVVESLIIRAAGVGNI